MTFTLMKIREKKNIWDIGIFIETCEDHRYVRHSRHLKAPDVASYYIHIVKLRSRSRSGEGQVRVRRVREVRFRPELYTSIQYF